MATHDRSIVDRMKKRVVEISNGQIIRDAQTASYKELSTEPNPIIAISPPSSGGWSLSDDEDIR
jgi:cell division transport system ATP-binding protein